MRQLLLLLLSVLLTGCSTLVTRPEVNVQRVNVVGVDTQGLDLEFYLNIRNPNAFDLMLKGYSYDVQVMTLPVARGGGRDSVAFKANGETDMRLPVRVEYSDLVEILKRRPDPDGIPYRLTAGLELDTTFGEILLPLEQSSTFAVPREFRPTWLLRQAAEKLQQVWQ